MLAVDVIEAVAEHAQPRHLTLHAVAQAVARQVFVELISAIDCQSRGRNPHEGCATQSKHRATTNMQRHPTGDLETRHKAWRCGAGH